MAKAEHFMRLITEARADLGAEGALGKLFAAKAIVAVLGPVNCPELDTLIAESARAQQERVDA